MFFVTHSLLVNYSVHTILCANTIIDMRKFF